MKKELIKCFNKLDNIIKYNNKNLTKKQYHELNEIADLLETVLHNMDDDYELEDE